MPPKLLLVPLAPLLLPLAMLPRLLVMPLYYVGQLMICTGVVWASAQAGSSTEPSAAR